MRQHRARESGASLAAVALALWALPCFVDAQITDPETPAASALWWTLDPAVEPSELRELHLDRAASLERFQEAVDAEVAEPLAPEVLERLTFYLNGRLHPELVPMWEALGWFVRTLDWGRESELRSRRRLEGHGVSPSGLDRILAEGHALLQESWRIDSEAREATAELRELVADASETGREAARLAWRRYDARGLAAATGTERGDLERLLDRSRGGRHWARAVDGKLRLLRDVLDDSDWASMRHMLKHDVAPKISTQNIEDG